MGKDQVFIYYLLLAFKIMSFGIEILCLLGKCCVSDFLSITFRAEKFIV